MIKLINSLSHFIILTEMNIFNKIGRLVKSIPKGKVTTYGEIAKTFGLKDNRLVGWAMHNNKDFKVPCHRVVFKDGSLAPSYAFGGLGEQKRKLESEGVKFLDEQHVNLEKYLWQPEINSLIIRQKGNVKKGKNNH